MVKDPSGVVKDYMKLKTMSSTIEDTHTHTLAHSFNIIELYDDLHNQFLY